MLSASSQTLRKLLIIEDVPLAVARHRRMQWVVAGETMLGGRGNFVIMERARPWARLQMVLSFAVVSGSARGQAMIFEGWQLGVIFIVLYACSLRHAKFIGSGAGTNAA